MGGGEGAGSAGQKWWAMPTGEGSKRAGPRVNDTNLSGSSEAAKSQYRIRSCGGGSRYGGSSLSSSV